MNEWREIVASLSISDGLVNDMLANTFYRFGRILEAIFRKAVYINMINKMAREYYEMKGAIYFCVFCCLAAFFLESRSFFLGYSAGLVFLCSLKSNLKRSDRLLLYFVFLLIVLCLVFFVKTDSSLGRMLIYKISWKMFEAHPWSGIGLGSFPREYLLYQASYFSENEFTQKEMLLADNTYYAFNDYFQFLIEVGVLAIPVLIAYFICLYMIVKQGIRSQNANSLLLISIANIIAISFAAFFTYVFQSILWTTVLAISIILLIRFIVDGENNLFRVGMLIVTGLVVGYYYHAIVTFKSYQKFEAANVLSLAGFHDESLKEFDSLYPSLKNDPWFLYSYGKQHYMNSDLTRAIEILEEAKTGISHNDLYLDLAECYFASAQYNAAEEYYLKSISMVPNRFYNRYRLFNFYLETNQPEKALQKGRIILQMPVKIPSARVDFMKQDVEKRVGRYLNVNDDS